MPIFEIASNIYDVYFDMYRVMGIEEWDFKLMDKDDYVIIQTASPSHWLAAFLEEGYLWWILALPERDNWICQWSWGGNML